MFLHRKDISLTVSLHKDVKMRQGKHLQWCLFSVSEAGEREGERTDRWCHFESSFSVSELPGYPWVSVMPMLTDIAQGGSQGRRHRLCSTQDHPEGITQGGRAWQKSRPTVAFRVPLSRGLGPTCAPGLWRITLRNSPAQAAGQATVYIGPKINTCYSLACIEVLLWHPKWQEGWLPLRPWCSPCSDMADSVWGLREKLGNSISTAGWLRGGEEEAHGAEGHGTSGTHLCGLGHCF